MRFQCSDGLPDLSTATTAPSQHETYVCLPSTSVTTAPLVTIETWGLSLGFILAKKPIKLGRHDARPDPKMRRVRSMRRR